MADEIDKTAQEPAYLKLYRRLVHDISAGIYPYGSKLPSKRILAETSGVSVITAEHALLLLSEEGYTEGRQRSGTFVTYRGEDFLGSTEPQEYEIPEYAQQTHNTGEFPFSLLAKTMRRVLSDYGERILVKSPNHGCPELRGEICRYLARSRGLQVRPSQVIIGSGSEYLYGLIVQLLGTDRIYALEKPSYSKIREVYEAMGATCSFLTMTRDGIASRELNGTDAQILHVTPFNSFPSGVTAGISKRREYLQWARRRGGILIEDDYNSELTVSGKAEGSLYAMGADIDVFYLNTFSRTVAPSMRIGYMILPARMVELFNRKLGFYSCTVPIFDQFVLAELLRRGDYERHIHRMRRNLRRACA